MVLCLIHSVSNDEIAQWFGKNYKKGTNVLKEYQMGGSLPGASGMMYARTSGTIPEEPKKAQEGTSDKFRGIDPSKFYTPEEQKQLLREKKIKEKTALLENNLAEAQNRKAYNESSETARLETIRDRMYEAQNHPLWHLPGSISPMGLEDAIIGGIGKGYNYLSKLGKAGVKKINTKIEKDIRKSIKQNTDLPFYSGLPIGRQLTKKVYNNRLTEAREAWLKGPKMNNKSIPLTAEETDMLRGMWKQGDDKLNNFVQNNHGFAMWLNREGKFTDNVTDLKKLTKDEKLVDAFLDEYLTSVRGVSMDKSVSRKTIRDAIVQGGQGRVGDGNYSSNSEKILERFSTPYRTTDKGYQTKLKLNLDLEGLPPEKKLAKLRENIEYSPEGHYTTHSDHHRPGTTNKPIIEQPYFGEGYERVVRRDKTDDLLKIKKLKSVNIDPDPNVKNLMGYQGLKDSEYLPKTFFLDDKFYRNYKSMSKADKKDITNLAYYHMKKHDLSYDEREVYRKLVSKIKRNKDIRKGDFPDTKKLDEGYQSAVEKTTEKFNRKLSFRTTSFDNDAKMAGSILSAVGLMGGLVAAAPESRSGRHYRIEKALENNLKLSPEDIAWKKEHEERNKKYSDKYQNGGKIKAQDGHKEDKAQLLADSDLNKGYEMVSNEKKFLKNWINSDRFKKKLPENLKEIERRNVDSKYDGWLDELLYNSAEEDADALTQKSLNKLNSVKVFGNPNYYPKKELSSQYKDVYGESYYDLAAREFGSHGSYSPSRHNIWLNSNNTGTKTHELTHATGLDDVMRQITPNSQKYTDLENEYKNEFKNKENIRLGWNWGDLVLKGNDGGWLDQSKTILSEKELKEDAEKKGYSTKQLRYLNRTSEVYARIMAIRKQAGLKPEDDIDDKKMEEVFEKTKNDDLYKAYSKEQVREMLNKMANVSTKNSNNNVAKNGQIIEDDRGQWAHPGEITKINSNNITMKGVNYPVLGISDTGDTQMMYPNEEYQYDGNSVTEYPMAKNGSLVELDQLTNFTNYNTPQPGGWLDKY